MFICPKCQNKVKYIVSIHNEVLSVDTTLHTIITERGRIVKGYKLHECDVRKD